MSIDAKIELVTYEQDGTATLHLGPRTKQDGPGQPQLTVVNPKPHMDALEGLCIWGNASQIMVGNMKLADRLSYTTIRLVEPPSDPPELTLRALESCAEKCSVDLPVTRSVMFESAAALRWALAEITKLRAESLKQWSKDVPHCKRVWVLRWSHECQAWMDPYHLPRNLANHLALAIANGDQLPGDHYRFCEYHEYPPLPAPPTSPQGQEASK